MTRTPAQSPRKLTASATRFFCIGSQKTGTTLLARILDQHPQIACVSESFALCPDSDSSLLNPYSPKWVAHGFRRATVDRWFTLWSLARRRYPPSPEDPLLQQPAREVTFRQVMPEALSDFGLRCGATVVGDKWNWYVGALDLVLSTFPGARFIYTVRDPRGLWNSGQRFLDRGHGNQTLGDMLAKDRQIQPWLASDRLRVVRYEDLVCAPERTARELYDFLGVESERVDLDYRPEHDPYPHRWDWVPESRQPPSCYHSNKWKTQMTAGEIAQVTAAAGDFFGRYGYEA